MYIAVIERLLSSILQDQESTVWSWTAVVQISRLCQWINSIELLTLFVIYLYSYFKYLEAIEAHPDDMTYNAVLVNSIFTRWKWNIPLYIFIVMLLRLWVPPLNIQYLEIGRKESLLRFTHTQALQKRACEHEVQLNIEVKCRKSMAYSSVGAISNSTYIKFQYWIKTIWQN